MTVSSFVTLTSKTGSFNLLFRFLGDGSVYVSVGFDSILVLCVYWTVPVLPPANRNTAWSKVPTSLELVSTMSL